MFKDKGLLINPLCVVGGFEVGEMSVNFYSSFS
nr:MAG TPA: hypothetical protein [Caudoviricetes sp.]